MPVDIAGLEPLEPLPLLDNSEVAEYLSKVAWSAPLIIPGLIPGRLL